MAVSLVTSFLKVVGTMLPSPWWCGLLANQVTDSLTTDSLSLTNLSCLEPE